jgi:2-iminobutanoate/2-iminopropanoate deaminase
MEFINADQAPQAIGPYSQAIICGDFVFCSGQTPLDPKTMRLVGDDIETQTRQVLRNLEIVLNEAGLTLQNVVKTTVFLKRMSDFAQMNAVYAEIFEKHRPARSTIEVSQNPLDALIEIECIAARKS